MLLPTVLLQQFLECAKNQEPAEQAKSPAPEEQRKTAPGMSRVRMGRAIPLSGMAGPMIHI